MKKRILTGIRPTGPLHLGHYVSMLSQLLPLQDEYEIFLMIADIQALTDNFDNPEKVRENVLEVLLDCLAVGIDPNKVSIFIQSEIPQIAELTVLFANLISIQQLSHNPTVKSEIKEKTMEKSTPLGFFMYPVSQAADISFVRADLVPVGEDQVPHIEMTADILKKFNNLYGEVFPLPKAKLTKVTRLVGLDGNAKMSKSLNNGIFLKDTQEEVKKKIMSMYTDPNRVHATDPGEVEGNPVFIYHDAFNLNKSEVNDLKNRYTEGKVGDIEVKEKLFKAIDGLLSPIRESREKFATNTEKLNKILSEGHEKATEEALVTMQKVRAAMHIDYQNIV